MLQLVTDRISMLNPAKDDTWYDPAKVREFMGVEPRQVADLLALKGDAVDNIPGAPGIGEKGARDLIAQFGSVPAALDRADEVTKRMARESLQNNRERIEMSLRLATIHQDVPLPFDPEALRVQEPDVESLKPLYKQLEFFCSSERTGTFPKTSAHGISRLSTPRTPFAVFSRESLPGALFRSHSCRIRTKSVWRAGRRQPAACRPPGWENCGWRCRMRIFPKPRTI